MKTLIESSIVINGMGRPDAKTIFNIVPEQIVEDHLKKDICCLCGRKISATFSYSENDVKTKTTLSIPKIPHGLTEEEVKDFILAEINKYLGV